MLKLVCIIIISWIAVQFGINCMRQSQVQFTFLVVIRDPKIALQPMLFFGWRKCTWRSYTSLRIARLSIIVDTYITTGQLIKRRFHFFAQ